jgi:hypothetical protein
VFLIGLSRLYLGVHFTGDVIGGLIFGGALLGLALFVEPPLTIALKKRARAEQVLLALAASFLMILTGALVRTALVGWQIPAEWIELGQRGELIDALAISALFTASGTFFGLATGAALAAGCGGFEVRGRPLQLLGRTVVGLAGVALLYFGLKVIFPEGEYLLAYVLRYVRYALIGFWITGLAPLIFIRLNLAKRGEIKDVQ